MPANPQVAAKTRVVIDRVSHAIVLTRTFDAPREMVFEAWTKPEHMACWWDAAGKPLAECIIDLRAGGAFKFVHAGAGHIPPFAGLYREITPPDRLVFEAMGALGQMSLESVRGQTLLTVTITCTSAAHLEQFLQMGVDIGTAQTLDNLAVYVGTMPL